MSIEDGQKEREMTFIADLAFATLTPQEMRQCVEEEGMKREYLKNPDAIAVFDAMMAAQGEDDTACYGRIIDVFNGRTDWLNRVCSKCHSGIGAYAKVNVRVLAETARKQIAQEGVGWLFAEYNSGKLDLGDLSRRIAELNEKIRHSRTDDDQGKTPDELGSQRPDDENPDALLRGWLYKSEGAFLIAETGKGKSVLSLQMAYCWARGVPAFGIEPMKPLKIAVFQTEDNDDEMRLFRDNLKRGFREIHGWTEQDLKAANDNIRLFSTEGLVGERFTDLMRRKLAGKNFDLVILNPLQGVFGGDVNKNDEITDFLRTKIDGVIKAEPTKCGILIVHHTNKPPLDYRLKRTDAYSGAGGAEFPNWMRASLVLDEQKDKQKETGIFHLVAAKRGKRLNWPGGNMKTIRHAPKESNLIFWLEDDSVAAGTGETKSKEQRLEEDKRLFVEELKREPITRTAARNQARSKFGRKRGDAIYEEIMEHLCDNGLTEVVEGNKRLIVGK